MKKTLIIISLLIFALIGCQKDQKTLSILVPNGIPSIAQSDLEYQKNQYNISRISGSQPLSAAFIAETHDVIIAPINLGANLFQKGANYQLAGILTWSNLQIISRTQINSLEDLEGQTLIAFGQGSIPEIVLTHLFNPLDFQNPVEIIYSATSVQESLLYFMQGSLFALVSEPVTSQAVELDDDIYIFDLASVWTDQTGLDLFPQAGVFIKNNLENAIVNQYLSDLETATNLALSNPSLIASQCESMAYPFDASLIEKALPQSQIDFQDTSQAKQAIDQMMNLIYEENPALIGQTLPGEDWLYTPS